MGPDNLIFGYTFFSFLYRAEYGFGGESAALIRRRLTTELPRGEGYANTHATFLE